MVVNEFARKSEGAPVALSNRHAHIFVDTPAIRLSSSGWIDLTPSGLLEITSSDLLYEITMEKLHSRISPFSKRLRSFVDSYVDHVAEQIQTLDQPDPEKELFTREDWFFSAWLPMPHAQILLPSYGDKAEMNFAEFDVAFWTGQHLICVDLGVSGSLIKSKRDKRNYLRDTQPEVVFITVPHDRFSEIDTNLQTFPVDLFDKNFAKFWAGLDIPNGPSPSPVLTSALRP